MTSQATELLSEEVVDRLSNDELLDEARDVVSGLEIRLQQVRAGVLDGKTAVQLLTQIETDLNPNPQSSLIKTRFPHRDHMNIVHFDGHTDAVRHTREEWWTFQRD